MEVTAVEIKSTEEVRPFIKTGEAAQLLGIRRETVRAAVKRGDLRGIRIGGMTLVSRAALMRLIAQGTGEPDRQPAA